MTNGNKRNTFIAGIAMELVMESSPHSPTDSSEDSVEVKVEAIASRSKRKLTEPRRLHDGPLKKRIRLEESTPFRPWSPSSPHSATCLTTNKTTPTSASISISSKEPTQSQSTSTSCSLIAPITTSVTSPAPKEILTSTPSQYFRPPLAYPPAKVPTPRIPIHPPVTTTKSESEEGVFSDFNSNCDEVKTRKEQRNYKNMTRERRIEANARERTRVHTISAAFNTLRRAVPAYSHSQKLSKLSVLRIACSYIMTLSNILNESDEVIDSVEHVTKTIQREGKLRKKKDSD